MSRKFSKWDCATPSERFWAKVDKSGECYLWLGALDKDGYGRFSYEGRNARAHQVAWLLDGRELPAPPLTLDHICHYRACVHVGHLRVATKRQQQRNRSGVPRNNTSGVRGVVWDKQKGMWRVQVAGKFGGYYKALVEAAVAEQALRDRLGS